MIRAVTARLGEMAWDHLASLCPPRRLAPRASIDVMTWTTPRASCSTDAHWHWHAVTSWAAWTSARTWGRISGSALAHSSCTYSRHDFRGTKQDERPSGLNTGDSMMLELCRLARDRVVLATAATATRAAVLETPPPWPPLPAPAAMAGPCPVTAGREDVLKSAN